MLDPDNVLVGLLAAALPMGTGGSRAHRSTAWISLKTFVGQLPFGSAGLGLRAPDRRARLGKLDQLTEPTLRKIEQLGAEHILGMLPECLGLDLRNAAATSDARPAILILGDTTEMLRSAGGVGEDAWLRELVWRSPGAVFVLLGRDPLDWAEREDSPARDWKAIVEEHPLDHLQDDEVEAILEGFPVAEPAVREVIRRGSAGLPFHVGVQLDIYRDLVEAGMEPLPEHFAATPGKVLERFRSHVGERLHNTLRTLAFARGFDAELFAFLKARPGQLVGEVLLSEVTRFSFVETLADGRYRLHQHYRDVECRETAQRDPAHARSIHEALFAFWDERCQPADVREVTSAHETALREAAHHKLRQGGGAGDRLAGRAMAGLLRGDAADPVPRALGGLSRRRRGRAGPRACPGGADAGQSRDRARAPGRAGRGAGGAGAGAADQGEGLRPRACPGGGDAGQSRERARAPGRAGRGAGGAGAGAADQREGLRPRACRGGG